MSADRARTCWLRWNRACSTPEQHATARSLSVGEMTEAEAEIVDRIIEATDA